MAVDDPASIIASLDTVYKEAFLWDEGRMLSGRWILGDQAVFAFPQEQRRTKHKPPKYYRNPVRMAQEWQNLLNRENGTPAQLARKLHLSRARFTQILTLLRLAPDVLQKIIDLGDPLPTPVITERLLRPIVDLLPNDQREWMASFTRSTYGISPDKARMASRVRKLRRNRNAWS